MSDKPHDAGVFGQEPDMSWVKPAPTGNGPHPSPDRSGDQMTPEEVVCPTCGLRDWRSAIVEYGAAHLCDDPFHAWRLLDAAKAELSRLRVEVRKLREDAKRYRWMRDTWDGEYNMLFSLCRDGGDNLDAAVDAAMNASPKEAL